MNKYKHYIDDPHAWLKHFAETRDRAEAQKIEKAISYYAAETTAQLQKGLTIADVLLHLGLDTETLVAAIIYPLLQSKLIEIDHIADENSETVTKLLQDIMQMQSLNHFKLQNDRNPQQLENLRKLLLAMVSDVRAILVVMAERVWQLHAVKNEDACTQQKIATETVNLYAPLANRLGIWQFKWEIEDLCLRYLQPNIYNDIAKSLAERREARESYIDNLITHLNTTLKQFDINDYKISGRVKHIYSIYKKMQRKNANFSAIYDITALRVMVPTIDDCYRVFSILTNTWQQIPEEFDDYIANPKPNGYRSIHVVVIGPQNKIVEVQIRTYQMHEESELGVAAHWRYKEGILQTSHYEAKIALLRQLMAWQRELSEDDKQSSQKQAQDLFKDRVYVFTPLGDVIDLPKGATPLDFAYTIHSEVGHRCRGAKINNHIMPLTYELQTGDRVEVLTGKQPHPSRDWLNIHYGYLKTSRARAKVQHWFKMMDGTHPVTEKENIEKDFKTNLQTSSDVQKKKTNVSSTPSIQILGINNLLTHIAYCCNPNPHDEIIGYITRMRGIRIHKKNCRYINQLSPDDQNRLIDVNWNTNR